VLNELLRPQLQLAGLPDMPGLFVVPGECVSSFAVQLPVPALKPFGHSRCRPAWLCCTCVGLCLFIGSSMLQQQQQHMQVGLWSGSGRICLSGV
jgi:hypothetical protein